MERVSPAKFTPSPYTVGPPIEDRQRVFGRERLFDFITDKLRTRSKVILQHGRRRIGKSTVLRQIPSAVNAEGFFFAPFDLQNQGRRPPGAVFHDLAVAIAERLEARLNLRVPLPTRLTSEREAVSAFSEEFLPRVYRELDPSGLASFQARLAGRPTLPRLVLLLDEFDVLGEPDREEQIDFFHHLERMIRNDPRLFLIPVIGRQLDDMPRLLTLFREAVTQEIGLLDPMSARRLITEPATGVLSYEDAAIDAILDLSAGHPYFTQLLCDAVFARARLRGFSPVTRDDVLAVIDDALKTGRGGLVWYRTGLPVPERIFLSAVAQTEEDVLTGAWDQRAPVLDLQAPWKLLEDLGVVPTEELRRAESNLIRWSFLREATRTEALRWLYPYELTIDLVRRWLVRDYPLRREIEQLEDADPEATNLYERGAEFLRALNPTRAIQTVEAALARNPNHWHARLLHAEALLKAREFDRAIDAFAQAYVAQPVLARQGYVQALIESGEEQLTDGQAASAREHFSNALRLEPEHPVARQKLVEAEERVRLSQAVRNPFVVGRVVPSDQFVGRRNETTILLDQFQKRGHTAVYGERQIGKTSLLRYVASPQVWRQHELDPTQAVILHVDCQSIQPFSPAGFWRELLLEFQDQVREDESLAEAAAGLARDGDLSWRGFRRLLQTLGRRGRFAVLLIDEFDVALELNASYAQPDVLAFLNDLRVLATQGASEAPFASVVATRRRLDELDPTAASSGSPLYNLFLYVRLGLFDESEVQSLLAKMPTSIPLTEAELEWVRAVAGRHPYLLQVALSQLFRLHAEERPFDISSITQEFVTLTEPFFTDLWTRTNPREKLLLALVALRNLVERLNWKLYDPDAAETILSQHERELRSLEERDLLVRGTSAGRTRYALFSSILEWWILKEAEAGPAEEVETLKKAVAEYLNSEQTEHLAQALSSLRQARRVFSSIEAWGRPI